MRSEILTDTGLEKMLAKGLEIANFKENSRSDFVHFLKLILFLIKKTSYIP